MLFVAKLTNLYPCVCLTQNQNTQTPNQSATRGAVGQNDAMTVMVLDATEPFEYESTEPGGKWVFHATVATVSNYFHVKVFNINLREKFTKSNVIKIANYVKFKGILEINEDSSVTEAGPNEKIEVPKKLIRRAEETPMISDINKILGRAPFYGIFTLSKKIVEQNNTIYEMKDDTDSIEFVGSGKFYNINCEEGDKLQLFSFQLTTIDKKPKLVCGDHSFIKVQSR
ncbi:Interferon-activable protein 204 [Lemmus lemmus]